MTKQQLTQHIMTLAAIDSTADNKPALRQAHDFMIDLVQQQAAGPITIERFEQNDKPSFLAYRGPKRPEKFDVILNAHLDVVPAKPELFKPFIRDNLLYGRGVLDMKGTTVVMADIFCQLVNKVPHNIALQVVTDEEVGGYDCTKVQVQEGVRANFVVMGEFSNHKNTIYNAARGLCWVQLGFKGKMAHGGHPWHGSNAVLKASTFTQALLNYYPIPQDEAWITTANIASFSTQNTTYNRVPDETTLRIDFRFIEEDPVFQSEDNVKKFLKKLHPGIDVHVEAFEPALKVEERNPYIQGMAAAITEITGAKAQFRSRPASSDGRHFAVVQNDVIEFGVLGQGQHSDAEYIELDSLTEYRSVLSHFLKNPLATKIAGPTTKAVKQK
ncbi:MAG TPA: M20/M25/M40 family metallo-hydrolase [Candidatus Saccharimonadales bacterium]|nr:M20/M25/M40 family metallo-hydrolase [Candidatus Saccharimonadales bacterium]